MLTVYIDTWQPRIDRQRRLLKHYNFQCQCAVCALPKKESEASDHRLSELHRLGAKLPEWNQGLSGLEVTRIVNQMFELMEEEGIEAG